MHEPSSNLKRRIISILIPAGITAAVAGASIAFAALTFSGTSIQGNGAVVIDSSSTISIGTSTATGVNIGSSNSTVHIGADESTLIPALSSYSGFPSTLTGVNDSSGTLTAGLFGIAQTSNNAWGVYGASAGSGPTGVEGDAITSVDDGESYGVAGNAGVYGAMNATMLAGVAAYSPLIQDGGTATETVGLYVQNQCNPVVTTCIGLWEEDESTSLSPNSYYSWFDSQGVRRVKEDDSFNGVGQAIEALYNPLFTKYTPGTPNYERLILGEWNSNVAEIGTENSGTGSSRALAFITASTTRMTIGATGNVGIGTGAPSTTLQVIGASSTIRIGNSALPGCIEMGNSDGSAGINYITVLNGVLTATTTKPSACQ